MNTLKRLEIAQGQNEPADLFLLRAMAVSLPLIHDEAERYALWHYLWRRAEAELREMDAANSYAGLDKEKS